MFWTTKVKADYDGEKMKLEISSRRKSRQLNGFIKNRRMANMLKAARTSSDSARKTMECGWRAGRPLRRVYERPIREATEKWKEHRHKVSEKSWRGQILPLRRGSHEVSIVPK